METFSALLAICAGNSPVTGEFPAQRPVTRSFDVFFDLRLNTWLSKQSRGSWFETPSHPSWRHCNAYSTFLSLLVTVIKPMRAKSVDVFQKYLNRQRADRNPCASLSSGHLHSYIYRCLENVSPYAGRKHNEYRGKAIYIKREKGGESERERNRERKTVIVDQWE